MNKHIDRRRFVQLGAGSVAALGFGSLAGALAGCSSSEGTSGTGAGDARDSGQVHESLTVLFSDAPNSFDPANKWDGWYTSCRGLTETLINFDEHMNYAPGLALSWESLDDLTWKISLREGVVFQSGRVMDADAVIASLNRTLERSARAAEKLQVASMSADGMTIMIQTKTPVATLPGELAEPVFGIVDTDVVEDTPHQAGTGPYKGENIERKEEFTLIAHEEYWGGTPAIKHITCRTVTDAQTRALALQSGDAQVAHSLLAQDLQTMSADGRYKLLQTPSVRSVFLMMNEEHSALQDGAVRQALATACDRDTLCDVICAGTLRPNGAAFPESVDFYNQIAGFAPAFDRTAAEKLLEEAGWLPDADGVRAKDGVRLEFTLAYYSSRPELTLIAPALQQMFGQIGVKITPQMFEQIDTQLHTGDFDLALYNATTLGNGDPSYFLSVYFDSNSTENVMHYANSQVDDLLRDMRTRFDAQERISLGVEALEVILKDAPCVFIGNPIMNVVEAPGVEGYELLPVEFYGITAALSWK